MIRLQNKNTIISKESPEGLEHIDNELQQGIFENNTFLPKGISIEDLDNAIVKFFNNEQKLIVNDKHIEAELYGIQRFYEFIKNWEDTDKTDNVELPLLSIVRNTITKRGTNFDKVTYNIPNNETYNVVTVPIVKNGKQSYVNYKIPQPLNVDVEYEINFFTSKLRDINVYNEQILYAFQHSQLYVTVLGHKMQIKYLGETDKSQKNLDKRKYYNYSFNIKLAGYLMNEDDFEIVQVLDTIKLKPIILNSEQCKPVNVLTSSIKSCDNVYQFTFNKKIGNEIVYNLTEDVLFEYSNRDNSKIEYYINDVQQTLPFSGNQGDNLKIIHNLSTNRQVIVELYGQTN